METEKKPCLAIVVPCYNEALVLEQTTQHLLAVLESGENGIRQKDLADRIGINASSLSEQIDRLETDRYLERRENPEDKRSTLIVLTEKGKARAWEVQDERQKTAEQFCARLTDAEKDTLIGLLDKLLAE